MTWIKPLAGAVLVLMDTQPNPAVRFVERSTV
jgi:hypothetical protein